MFKRMVLVILLCMALCSAAEAERFVFVTPDGAGSRNGTDWENAINSADFPVRLKQAPSGSDIIFCVAKGVYKPTSGDARDATFTLNRGVRIYGGFNGTETLIPRNFKKILAARDITANETTLTGDIGTAVVSSDNVYHVVTGQEYDYVNGKYPTSADTVLDGFTVTGGNADKNNSDYGGGMINFGRLANCKFIDNAAADRGGGVVNSAFGVITDCQFIRNSAAFGGGVSHGAIAGLVTNCTFTENSAYQGGGMDALASVVVTNCTFTKNRAAGTWKVYTDSAGGGMLNQGNVTNCTFVDNSAQKKGGGMSSCTTDSEVTNCTFKGNTAGTGSGMDQKGNIITNCIFWDTRNDEITNLNTVDRPKITNCIINVEANGLPQDNSNNDPQLQDLTDNGGPTKTCAIPDGSCAINAGKATLIISGDKNIIPLNDQRGYLRVSSADIGAFEYGGLPLFTITATAGPKGSIDPSGDVTVISGNNREFTITADEGYEIEVINVDDSMIPLSGNTYKYTFENVTANHTIDVLFKAVATGTRTITATCGPNGTITPRGTVPVILGGSQAFTVTPNKGFEVDTLKVDGSDAKTGATKSGDVYTYTFTRVTANHTIAATFKEAAPTPPGPPPGPQPGGGSSPEPTPAPTPAPAPVTSSDVPAEKPADASVTPDANGRISEQPVQLPNNQTASSIVEQQRLNANGIEARVGADGKLLISGEPKDIGVFPITVILSDGTNATINIEVKAVPVPAETLVNPSESRTAWNTIISGTDFEITLTIKLDASPAGRVEQPSLVMTGGVVDESEIQQSKARGASGERLVKFSGTLTDPANAKIEAVKYRVGVVEYTQVIKDGVKLSDTNVTQKTPDTQSGGSSGGGCDAGFGVLALLAAGAIITKKRG